MTPWLKRDDILDPRPKAGPDPSAGDAIRGVLGRTPLIEREEIYQAWYPVEQVPSTLSFQYTARSTTMGAESSVPGAW